jgi:hypothetical protein
VTGQLWFGTKQILIAPLQSPRLDTAWWDSVKDAGAEIRSHDNLVGEFRLLDHPVRRKPFEPGERLISCAAVNGREEVIHCFDPVSIGHRPEDTRASLLKACSPQAPISLFDRKKRNGPF